MPRMPKRSKTESLAAALVTEYPNPAYERSKKSKTREQEYLKGNPQLCLKCLKPLSKPVFTCKKGHSCCGACRNGWTSCVVCFEPLGNYSVGCRSRSPEAIQKMIRRCLYAEKEDSSDPSSDETEIGESYPSTAKQASGSKTLPTLDESSDPQAMILSRSSLANELSDSIFTEDGFQEFIEANNLEDVYMPQWSAMLSEDANQIAAYLASKMIDLVHCLHKIYILHGSLKLKNFGLVYERQELQMVLTNFEKSLNLKSNGDKVIFKFPHFINTHFFPEKWTVELTGYQVDYRCLAASIGALLSKEMLVISDHFGENKVNTNRFGSSFQKKKKIWAHVIEVLLNACPIDLRTLSKTLQENLIKEPLPAEKIVKILKLQTQNSFI